MTAASTRCSETLQNGRPKQRKGVGEPARRSDVWPYLMVIPFCILQKGMQYPEAMIGRQELKHDEHHLESLPVDRLTYNIVHFLAENRGRCDRSLRSSLIQDLGAVSALQLGRHVALKTKTCMTRAACVCLRCNLQSAEQKMHRSCPSLGFG